MSTLGLSNFVCGFTVGHSRPLSKTGSHTDSDFSIRISDVIYTQISVTYKV